VKIAFVSYEYPPDTAFGGIATYVQQAARLLAGRGHRVEVFAASDCRVGFFEDGKVGVHLVGEMDRARFADVIEPIFSKRHVLYGFDVIESPEYYADGRSIRQVHPGLAHVVKLHTPSEIIDRSGTAQPQLRGFLSHHTSQTRIIGGAIRRLQSPPRWRPYRPNRLQPSNLYQIEREYAKNCDLVVSPSQALADWAAKEWALDPARVAVVPNPFVPSKGLLNIKRGGTGGVVGFFGRLEQRKGLADLIEAIPRILEAEPKTRFRFVGRPLYHPATLERYDDYLLRKLKRFRSSIELVGACALDQMPEQYGAVDICVFPSIWENFPNVCLEAMAAGRAIVASSAGGMAEMLEGGLHGILVPPKESKALAEGVIHMLRSPDQRVTMGTSARKRLLDTYSIEKVGPQLEQSFEAAITFSNERKPFRNYLHP
jgi:glycogen synthase